VFERSGRRLLKSNLKRGAGRDIGERDDLGGKLEAFETGGLSEPRRDPLKLSPRRVEHL